MTSADGHLPTLADDCFPATDSRIGKSSQGRALLPARRRRRAGMLRIAVGRLPAALHRDQAVGAEVAVRPGPVVRECPV